MTQDRWTLEEVARHAQELAQELAAAQEELALAEYSGSAGGGLVNVTMRGDGEVTRLVIDQQAVDDGDALELAALVLGALRTAAESMRAGARTRAADLAAISRFPTAHLS